MALLDIPARFWSFLRRLEDLATLQVNTEKALAAVTDRLRALEDRMTHLEAAQGQIVVEARSAAGAAAITVAGAILSDVVIRVTRIEMRAEDATRRIQGSDRR